VGGLIGRAVGALIVIIGIALVFARIVSIWVGVIGVSIIGIAVGIPIIVWIESEIVDEPCAINKTATMAMPPMITTSVPIAMPIGRASPKDMVTGGVWTAVFETISEIVTISSKTIFSLVGRSRCIEATV